MPHKVASNRQSFFDLNGHKFVEQNFQKIGWVTKIVPNGNFSLKSFFVHYVRMKVRQRSEKLDKDVKGLQKVCPRINFTNNGVGGESERNSRIDHVNIF